jgi:hypothetical protein
MSAPKKPTRAEQERAAAEQRRLAPVLREAHALLRLWRLCDDQTCRRSKRCRGDADQCGVRLTAQGWEWLHHVIKAIREGKAQENAVEAANQAVLGYRQRVTVRWKVKGWEPIELVQLADAIGGGRTSRPLGPISIRNSSSWRPRLGCATRCAPMRRSRRVGKIARRIVARPHPEEARSAVSKDEASDPFALMLRDASQRGSAVERPPLASRCDAPQHEGGRGIRMFAPHNRPTCGCTGRPLIVFHCSLQ